MPLSLLLPVTARARASPSDLDLTGTGRCTVLSSFFREIQSMDFDLDFIGTAGTATGFWVGAVMYMVTGSSSFLLVTHHPEPLLRTLRVSLALESMSPASRNP